MAEDRLRLDTQLQKSAVPGSVPVTNGSNNLGYTSPGSEGAVFTIIGGIPTWGVSAAGTKHAHVLGAGPYVGGNPMSGWTSPPGPVLGDTIVVKYTDNVLGYFTHDGSSWVLNFTTNEEIQEFNTLVDANIALGIGKVFRYTDNNVHGFFGLEVTH